MSITEVPELVCKDQKTQFPQKNRLSNRCVDQATIVQTTMQSRHGGGPLRHVLVEVKVT